MTFSINQWRNDVEQQLQEFRKWSTIRDIVLARSNFIDEALFFLESCRTKSN
jgi:[protein-PII] uridylyltransferase